MPYRGTVGGSQRWGFVPGNAVNEKPADSVAACKTTVRRAVCLNWASTDLWEARRETAGLTRPFIFSQKMDGYL
jgi:hypothetical protein